MIDTNNDNKPDSKQKVEHKNPKDKSQTVVVPKKNENPKDGNLATTVSANGKTASATEEVNIDADEIPEVKTVIDTLKYTNLIAGQEYTVTGHLNKIVNGEVVETIATKTESKIADASGSGEWTIEFDVTGKLVEDARYVAYEEAVSRDLVLDTDNDNRPDSKQKVEHKDPKDKSQTVVTKKTPNGFVKIIKKDGDTQKQIAGATFDIYAQGADGTPSGTILRQVFVAEEGTQIDLARGKYVAVEINPPAGYVLPENELDRQHKFEIESQHKEDSPIELVVYNKKPEIPPPPTTSPMLYLTKVDEQGRPLAGATISVFKQGEDTPILTGVTNENGKIDKDTATGSIAFDIEADGRIKLEYGDYVVREDKAPNGYVLNPLEQIVKLTTDAMVGIATIVNQKETPKPISVVVKKTWTNVQSGKTPADYSVTVQLVQNGVVIDTKVITGDSEAVFENLPKKDAQGNEYVYDVVEVENSGYKQESKVVTSKTDEQVVYEFVNRVVPPEVPPTPPNTPNTPPSIPSIPNNPNEPNTPPSTPPEEPPVTIVEEPTPLATPEEVVVEEDDVPLAPPIEEIEEDVPLGLPKTGSEDTTAMGIVLLGLGLIVLRKKRRK